MDDVAVISAWLAELVRKNGNRKMDAEGGKSATGK